MAEYRVREEIYFALKQRTSDPHLGGKFTCERCSAQAAFQRALCYKIGFGTPSDAEKSTDLLSTSARGKSNLENEVSLLMQTRPDPFDGQSAFARLWKEGSLFTSFNDFRDILDPKISDIEQRYLREISDMDSVLGDNNAITHTLKMGLTTTYEQQGKFEQAERTCRLALQSNIKVLGDRHIVTLECMDRLARTLWGTGNLLEAKDLQQSAVDSMRELLGNDHIHTKRLLQNLCVMLEIEGRFKENEHFHEKTFNSFCVNLGSKHLEVLVTMDNWAVSKRYAGNLKFSTTLQGLVVSYCEEVLEPNHLMTQ